MMNIRVFVNDIPEDFPRGTTLAVDTEAMGLRHDRDRLCLVQLSWGDGTCFLVKIGADAPQAKAPRLRSLLGDKRVEKLFHFARFDMGILNYTLGVIPDPIYCTKIASRLARTYTDRHGLRSLCRELLNTDISKVVQSSDWGAHTLTEEQKIYAATDVLHLHGLRSRLDEMLRREGRWELAKTSFGVLPSLIQLERAGWDESIFAYAT